MFTPLNRAELLVTYDVNQLNRARDALAAAGVDCRYSFRDLGRSSFPRGLTGENVWAHTSVFGVSSAARVEYKLYVLRDQLEQAQALLREAGL